MRGAAKAAGGGSRGKKATAKKPDPPDYVAIMDGEVGALGLPENLHTLLVFVYLREILEERGSFRCFWCRSICWSGTVSVERLKWINKVIQRRSGRSAAPDVSLSLPLKYRYCSMKCATAD